MTPAAKGAAAVVHRTFVVSIQTTSHFPTGLAYYGFEVLTADERRVVARLARSDQEGVFASALY